MLGTASHRGPPTTTGWALIGSTAGGMLCQVFTRKCCKETCPTCLTRSRQHVYNRNTSKSKGDPLTTHYPPPPPSTKGWPAWILPTLTGIAGALIGILLGALIFPAPPGAPTSAPAACSAAFDHVDTIIELYSGAFLDAADAMDAYQDRDYSAMNRHTGNIESATGEVRTAIDDYNLAKGECLEN